MKRYGRIQGLILALGSPSFYHDVARHWGGIGILYLLLLFGLTWIPALIKMQLGFGQFVRDEVPKAMKDFPTITIQGGKASSPVAQPYTIDDPETGEPVFVLDTTGEISSLEDTKANLLLTETHLHVRRNPPGKIEIHDLKQFPNFTVSKELIQEWLSKVGNWVGVGLFPFVLVGSLIRVLVVMFIAAIIGLIFNSSSRAGLSFGTLLRLAAVGMTLSVYIDTGLQLAEITVPFWFWIAVAITACYVALGVKAAGTEEAPMELMG